MSGARPAMLSSPLAVLVLLPDALSPNAPSRTKIAPPLISRNSGGAVPRMSGLTTWTTTADANDAGGDPPIVQSRRLSLAPNLGTGQSKPSVSPTSMGGFSPLTSLSPLSSDKPRRSGPARKSSIPDHIANSPALSKPRASVAYPSGQGLPNIGRRRTHSVGDELVDLFRASGVEGELQHIPGVFPFQFQSTPAS